MGAKETKELEQLIRRLKFAKKKDISSLLRKAKELIAGGANLKLIWEATWSGNLELFEMILSAGGNPKAKRHGSTLLHRAAAFGSTKIIRRLIELGLDPNAVDKTGLTPLQAARQSKHSGNAVSVLGRIIKSHFSAGRTKSRKKASAASTSKKTKDPGELQETAVRKAWKSLRPAVRKEPLFRHGALTRFDEYRRAAFSDRDTTTTERFLADLAALDEPALVYAGLRVVHETVKGKAKAIKLGARSKVPRVIAGNLTIQGSHDAKVLVVTGNLEVKGKLSNYEGRCIYVGGNLKADTIYTEGPILVIGNVQAKILYGFYNDYSLRVGGTLSAGILVEHDHLVEAGRVACSQHFRRPQDDLPKAVQARVRRVLGVRSKTLGL
jgi:hypothetical protein